MSDNQRKILEMLAENKISIGEADRLLSLTQSENLKAENLIWRELQRFLQITMNAQLVL